MTISILNRYNREQDRLLRSTLPHSGVVEFALRDVTDSIKPEWLTGPGRRAALTLAREERLAR